MSFRLDGGDLVRIIIILPLFYVFIFTAFWTGGSRDFDFIITGQGSWNLKR
jgi:hypothetical protein